MPKIFKSFLASRQHVVDITNKSLQAMNQHGYYRKTTIRMVKDLLSHTSPSMIVDLRLACDELDLSYVKLFLPDENGNIEATEPRTYAEEMAHRARATRGK